ncbi:MAG: hypothetical protein ACFCVE_03855 [Phycisphaerae bacterium]
MRFIRNLAPPVVVLFSCVWLGCLIMTLATVITLFGTDRDLAVQAAPILFGTFEPIGLGLAVITWVFSLVWAWTSASKRLWTMSGALVSALILVGAQFLGVSFTIDRLRVAGQADGEAFDRLHQLANFLYLGQGLCVVLAVLLAMHAFRRDPACRL